MRGYSPTISSQCELWPFYITVLLCCRYGLHANKISSVLTYCVTCSASRCFESHHGCKVRNEFGMEPSVLKSIAIPGVRATKHYLGWWLKLLPQAQATNHILLENEPAERRDQAYALSSASQPKSRDFMKCRRTRSRCPLSDNKSEALSNVFSLYALNRGRKQRS